MMRHRVYRNGLLMLACWLSVAAWAAPLPILSLARGQLNAEQQQQICRQAPLVCADTQQWHSVTTPDQRLWVLANNRIAAFSVSAQGLQLQQQWHIPLPEYDESNREDGFIYPKLFAMAAQRYAVAVIHGVSEMYSGGGARFEEADFYELKADGAAQPFIQNYPFGFNRMIRACFSEQDYRAANMDCHDEDSLTLDIRPLKPLFWQFRYTYNIHVSPASDSGEKSHRSSRYVDVDLNHAPQQPNIPAAWRYDGQ